MIAAPTTNRPALIIVFPAAVILLVIAAAASLTGCRRSSLQPNLPQIYSPPAAPGSGKPPVIFIPGMLGSRLVNRRTGEVVWPDLRVDGEAIALPISSPVLAQNTDEGCGHGGLEEAKVSALIPEISVYGPLLKLSNGMAVTSAPTSTLPHLGAIATPCTYSLTIGGATSSNRRGRSVV